ncbi:MAG: tetratricopeptide repeat protein [candidate division Zixibacteria bacterium]|nr:tetratricopeptide repeat protein [candidate division Zixibacteria bacterium]
MKRPVATALLIALLIVACGPKRPAGYFVYEGRRGDSVAALSARFGGDEGLTKILVREARREADAPFEAGERVAIPFEKIKKHRDIVEAFALVHEARGARARGEYAAALEALRAAYAARPDDPSLAFELGATYYEAGDYGRAAAALGGARERAPDDEEVILAFALAAAEAGDAEGAVATLAELATQRPDFLYALYVLAEMEIKMGKYAAGRHHLFEYLRQRDKGLVAAYAREGIKASARAEMEAAARALGEAAREEEKATPAREAGPAE